MELSIDKLRANLMWADKLRKDCSQPTVVLMLAAAFYAQTQACLNLIEDEVARSVGTARQPVEPITEFTP